MSIDKRPNGKYRARWREVAGGPQKSATFDRKIDAQRHLVKMSHDLLTGVYVDPRQGQTLLGFCAERWLERMRPTWRPGTTAAVENSVRLHIAPTLGKSPLAAIRRADVEAWAAALDLSPATVATVRQHLGQILSAAVDDGLIARNPATASGASGGPPEKPLAPSTSTTTICGTRSLRRCSQRVSAFARWPTGWVTPRRWSR